MLSEDVERCVDLHRTVGFKYRVQAGLLRSFARFAEAVGDRYVRIQTVLQWAALAPSAAQRRNRLLTVRRFAEALRAENGQHEMPPADPFGRASYQRRRPYIYDPSDIEKLLAVTDTLRPPGSIRPATYRTLFGLIAATGIRISEALALQVTDITDDGLLIRETKFRKSRLLPLHSTVRRALDHYLSVRAPHAATHGALFLSMWGRSLSYSRVTEVFLSLARSIGLRAGPDTPGPRIHDLRHSFAVRSLERCGHGREAVARHMLALSTYLGHAHLADTYWYLQTTPKLLEGIALSSESLHAVGQP